MKNLIGLLLLGSLLIAAKPLPSAQITAINGDLVFGNTIEIFSEVYQLPKSNQTLLMRLHCYVANERVLDSYKGPIISEGTNQFEFILGPTPTWSGEPASCVASMYLEYPNNPNKSGDIRGSQYEFLVE